MGFLGLYREEIGRTYRYFTSGCQESLTLLPPTGPLLGDIETAFWFLLGSSLAANAAQPPFLVSFGQCQYMPWAGWLAS